MTAKSRELREERARLAGEYGKLDSANAEDRAKGSEMMERINELEGQIKHEEGREALHGVSTPEPQKFVPETEKKASKQDMFHATRAWMAGNYLGDLPDADRCIEAAKRCGLDYRNPQLGFTAEARASATSNPIGWGPENAPGTGHVASLVPIILHNEIEKYMVAFGGVEENSRVINTQTGANMTYPVITESTIRGTLTAENTQSTVQTFASTKVDFNAYKITSDIVRISVESLQDPAFPMPAIIGEILGERIARAKERYHTIGASSNTGGEPDGVVGGTTLATTSFNASLGVRSVSSDYNNITSTDLLALYHSVDPAYRTDPRWMLNDDSLLKIRQLSLGSTYWNPVWQPSLREGEPDRILGVPYIINQFMPTAGSSGSKKIVAFGDFSKMVIRNVQGMSVVRFSEKYMDYWQQGFLAAVRTDSHVINSNALKYLITSTA